MKPTRDWDEAYILRGLPIGEHDWFETKGRRALDLTIPNVKEHDVRETLSKALSAFANTGGGQVVYGLENQKGATERRVDDGGIAITGPKGDTRVWCTPLSRHQDRLV